jgi:peptidoglycan hydrolase-like protein with peptidoglycan-binding domain
MKLTLKIDRKRNMAYTIHETYVGAQPYNWYNVSRPVGQNATNLYDDVCLVQILLAYLRPYVAVLRDPQLRQIIPDGICGPITQAYIEAYQSHITVRRSAIYHPDGVVEPGRPWQKETASGGPGTMIVQLNFELWERARAAHEGIPTDLRTPPFLRASLRRMF